MAQARSSLEAQLANDPEHPAIRKCLVNIESILSTPADKLSLLKAVALITIEMAKLKTTLKHG